MRGEITITDDELDAGADREQPVGRRGQLRADRTLAFDATLPCPRSAVSFNYRTVADTADGIGLHRGRRRDALPSTRGTAASTVLKITIKVKGDTLDELNESFKLELLNPTTGAVVRTAIGHDHERRQQLEALDR